jgi:hypothetical protein
LEKYPSVFAAEDVFLVSLSEACDLLNQWRGYAPNGGGYSTDQMDLVRCLYNEDELKDLVRRVLEMGVWTIGIVDTKNANLVGNRRPFSISPVVVFRV